jgi:hypothetical protein
MCLTLLADYTSTYIQLPLQLIYQKLQNSADLLIILINVQFSICNTPPERLLQP